MKMESVIKGGVAAVGGLIVYWLGGVDKLLTVMIVAVVLDYLTGVLKAIIQKQLTSEIGFRGIAKKVFYFAIVALAYAVESLTGAALPLREIVIMFFVANEGLSILENAAQAGVPVPERLKNVLLQLRDKEDA